MSARPIRSYVELLGLLSRGRFVERLDEELTAAVAALESAPSEKGKATITVALDLAFQSGRLDIKPTVKAKLPEDKAFGDTVFWTYEGGLSVQHPSQMDIFGGPRAAEERQQDRARDRA